MKKQYRKRSIKPGQLVAYYGVDDGGDVGVVMGWGDGPGGKRDSHLLYWVLTRPFEFVTDGNANFITELEARGYDITTLKFSIEKKSGRSPD